MSEQRHAFDYAVVRVVPRVEREEFLNVGVIVCCRAEGFLKARFDMDEARLAAFAPGLNIADIQIHLDAMQLICVGGDGAGPIGKLPPRARFDWLVAPRSTIIQTSAVHTGLCADPELAVTHLLTTMVSASGLL
ncbi:MAG TPA: DUF3037 domain-containing protein [Pyrinomonadaceae bacterium]|nr:DUF3037 domain-containing protein [Pyrinomonadaceae bacterium]